MLTLLRIRDGEVTGWVISRDVPQMRAALNARLNDQLRAIGDKLSENNYPPGKHDLGDGYWLLVG